jgi:hypothetical protein
MLAHASVAASTPSQPTSAATDGATRRALGVAHSESHTPTQRVRQQLLASQAQPGEEAQDRASDAGAVGGPVRLLHLDPSDFLMLPERGALGGLRERLAAGGCLAAAGPAALLSVREVSTRAAAPLDLWRGALLPCVRRRLCVLGARM